MTSTRVKRVWPSRLPAILLAFAFTLVGHSVQSASPSPKWVDAFEGVWVRESTPTVTFIVSLSVRGRIVVVSHGDPGPNQPANACWQVFAGSPKDTGTGTKLVLSSDASPGSSGVLTETDLAPYEGLFVDFNSNWTRARMSGPEARFQACPLSGEYLHQPSLPSKTLPSGALRRRCRVSRPEARATFDPQRTLEAGAFA